MIITSCLDYGCPGTVEMVCVQHKGREYIIPLMSRRDYWRLKFSAGRKFLGRAWGIVRKWGGKR